MIEPASIKQAFDRYLEELNLKEFPCGDGKWRNNLEWKSDLLDSKLFADNASLLTNESLLELTDHVAFKKDLDWSTNAKDVIKKSIKEPKRKSSNICKQFKTLRLVDQNITSVDTFINQFHNLEELTLSANKITSFDSNVLPLSLRVLELCGNNISDINFLCVKPSTLHHVGLSYNYIRYISDFVKPKYWDSLLSLDVSFNFLDDLRITVETLKCLPKLRILLLQGNPLYLFMGYRGYVIDSLTSLTSLDDIDIFADERYLYKGISELKCMPFNYSMITCKLDDFESSITDEIASQPDECPITLHKYHVELDFVEGSYIFNDCDLGNNEVNAFMGKGSSISSQQTNQKYIYENNQSGLIENNEGQIIKSNEFEISKGTKELNFNKCIVSNNTKALIDFLSHSINVKLVKNLILMSNASEPKSIEVKEIKSTSNLLLSPSKSKNTLSSTNDAPSVKKSISKLSPSKTSVANSPVNEKNTKEIPNEKDKKKSKKTSIEDLHEWSRTNKLYGKDTVDCRLLLSGVSIIENHCVFKSFNDIDKLNERSPIQNMQDNNVVPCIEIVSVEEPDDTQHDRQEEKPQHTSKTAISVKKSTKSIPNLSRHKDVCLTKSKEYIKPPSSHFRIEVLRWNSKSEGIEWMKKFKIQ